MGVMIITISSIGLKEFPKVGTFMNMIFVGLFIDLFNWIIPNPHTFSIQLIDFILGTVLIAVGAGIYISANLGAGPRDSLMLFIVEKFRCNITVARTFMEVVVAIVGFLLGGPIGIGTIIMAFALGPIIQVTLRYSRLLLGKCLGTKKDKHAAVH